MPGTDGGGDLQKGNLLFCGRRKTMKEEEQTKVIWLDVL